MRVEITDLGSDLPPYVASSPAECRDRIDAMAYELACEHGTVITLGKIIAQPVLTSEIQ